MDIIQLINNLLSNNKCLSNEYEIIINNKKFSFFEGINIIDCNKLSKDQYAVKCKDNIKVDANYSSFFSLFNILERKSKEKIFKYNFDLKDTTKTSFYIPVNISIHTFKEVYNKLIKLDLPNTCQYVIGFIGGLHYYHYFNNDCYTGSYNYNQNLIKMDRVKDIEDLDNYIIIRCCHDCIKITHDKIVFSERDTYDNIICRILPCFNYTNEQILIRFTPCDASFIYPISINFQLFDLMLYENGFYPYIYANESDSLIKCQEKLVYTMNILNKSINMLLYNKYKQFTETIQFQDLEWYMYSAVKKVLKYLYLFYIDFHIRYYQRNEPFSTPIKINYNRLFGKYYTRYFNNKDKVLPVIADKDYCVENNIPYVQWNSNYYRAPENSGYKIILSTNKKYTDNNGIPKCVKVIRKYKEKREVVYFNITHELNEHCKGQFPSNLFISYGFELLHLYRVYFDIPEISSKFTTCPKCNTYISIPSQKDLVNTIKDLLHHNQLKILNKNYSFNDVNILSFSIDNDMNVYPYCVFNHVYSFNPFIPFLIVILNTSKLYTFPNYRFEFVVGPNDNWFNFNDDLVQAIFSMYKKNSILIMDSTKLNKCIKQYVLDNDTATTTILIAEKEYPNENFYLWRSIYSEVIPKIPIIKDAEEFHNTLPSFSFLCKTIKSISAFHYNALDENNEKFMVYGVWENEIYYPCKASLEIL
ncbi:hypothetical protein BCR36DRAFT_416706 [Piromyces finnis]|uniref:Uncharacterized protein n=1 Tax=Piromyces finnis TaxID=1754191 RepID=A0A1Y1UU75_9FUNG|nr:hypothetical protein BCR36DRAFT_416695 [Piromyces finnis]ORX41598.1 hypothetical protein BCR36DRAFT_416706 [Piromyces finnis]|eukprot:ORX41574.1 hypothetical protein BCR36DRAFT_416695 [Piromyces finnis]